jgi:ParB-like chromosome segregation protein Spo0J
MKIEPVSVEGVHVGARHRSVVDQEKLDALAESMASLGLLQPITVYAPDDATVELVAGLHRLEAARRLGWDKIDAIFMTGSEIDRELAEITENLHRIDLTKEQRDQHIRRCAELLRMREVSPQDAAQPKSGPKGGRKSIARKIAEETGLSDDTVRRALNPKPPHLPGPPPPKAPAPTCMPLLSGSPTGVRLSSSRS